jgi:hypothetical protein
MAQQYYTRSPSLGVAKAYYETNGRHFEGMLWSHKRSGSCLTSSYPRYSPGVGDPALCFQTSTLDRCSGLSICVNV